MAHDDYLPKTDAALMAWHDNFKDELAGEIGTRLGVTAATNAALAARNTRLHELLTAKNDAERAYRASVTAWTSEVGGAEDEVRPLVQRLKTSPEYTTSDGEDLEIIGSEIDKNLSNKAPVLKAKTDASGVELSYTKGVSDGINLYCRRATETEFSFTKRLTKPKGRDDRPNLAPGAEKREYYAVYVQGDNEVGLKSPIVTVNL